jgi:hypothetical protein
MYTAQKYPCPPYGYYGYGCLPCPCGTPMISPYELAIASGGATAQAFVGGAAPARLSLEYVVDDGASSPTIKVTTVSAGSTSTWEETAPASGYQVKSDFMSVQPGTKVTLDATETTARLRWCETFCC